MQTSKTVIVVSPDKKIIEALIKHFEKLGFKQVNKDNYFFNCVVLTNEGEIKRRQIEEVPKNSCDNMIFALSPQLAPEMDKMLIALRNNQLLPNGKIASSYEQKIEQLIANQDAILN